MFSRLLDTLAPAYHEKRHRDLLTAQWEQERWFDTPRQRRAAEIACEALRAGGLTDDTIKWSNTWGDNNPDGWYLYASDTVLPGFCISAGAGRRLRARLAAEPDVQLAGFCDSRLYAGEAQAVTATLPGTDPSREIWLFAHGGECGANDNCSGTTAWA